MPRTALRLFEMANPLYKGAMVTFYTVVGGVKTANKATLYAAPTGVAALQNPQQLDSRGKLKQPIYHDVELIASIDGIHVPSHDTGIVAPAPTFRVASTGALQYSYDGEATWNETGDYIFRHRGAWAAATDYQRNDVVAFTPDAYIALSDHVSTASFAADLAAGKWRSMWREPFINVKNYGAVGDGATNDTAAIQAAIDVAAAAGRALFFPGGNYLCGALTAPAGDLIWFGERDARLTCTGNDITLISPLGDVDITGIGFSNYLNVFKFNSVATGSKLKFRQLDFSECGTITTSGGSRQDFNAAIGCNTAAANVIELLYVEDCEFDGDDFGIAYRSGFNNAIIENCRFKNMHRMGIQLGDNSGDQRTYKNVSVRDCKFKDIIANDAVEFEIHGALIYCHYVEFAGNHGDTCYDINATTHDSEMFYLKCVGGKVHDNTVKDGAHGDAYLTIKGVASPLEPLDMVPIAGGAYSVNVEVYSNFIYQSDDFQAAFPHDNLVAGIYLMGSRIHGHHNEVRGTFHRGILIQGSGRLSHNYIRGAWEYGAIIFLEGVADLDPPHEMELCNNTFYLLGNCSAMAEARVSPTVAMTVPMVKLNDNTCITSPTGTFTGSVAAINVRADRLAVGNNRIECVQVEGNLILGRAGARPNGICIVGEGESGANGGRFGIVHMANNTMDQVESAHRLALVASGDVDYAFVDGALCTNINARMLSNPDTATVFKARNLRGARESERSGTATIAAGSTSVTVAMGFQDTLRPTSLANIDITPTSDNGASTTWWTSNLSGDNFNINVDIAPGGAGYTFVWRARNRYYY